MITLVISVFITKKRLFVQSLLTITIPTALFGIITLAIMLFLNVNIWYYNLDVVVTQVCFLHLLREHNKTRGRGQTEKYFH